MLEGLLLVFGVGDDVVGVRRILVEGLGSGRDVLGFWNVGCGNGIIESRSSIVRSLRECKVKNELVLEIVNVGYVAKA